MREDTVRRSLPKRILLVFAGLCAFILLFLVACRIAVQQIFMGIEQSRSTGLNGVLRDALALEKEIAQANQAVVDAQRQHEDLLSTVALARIRFNLMEEYRAPLEANFADVTLRLRNSLIEGIGAIFSSAGVFVGVLFEYGLPLVFWIALLFVPGRFIWRRLQVRRLVAVGTQP